MSAAELPWESAVALAERVRAGSLSARELADACLARIEAHDGELNAFVHVDPARVRADADALDARVAAGEDPGPLAGVPCAVKDNLCTLDQPTSAGSRLLADFAPPYEATAVSRLRAAGALVLGKANLDEFGMGSSGEASSHGASRNPFDRERVPGGSSSGSAVAVAAGLAPLALGSDTGGSIRQPAALCGVVGFKPSYGRVSRSGLIAYASSLDQVGPLCRSVGDLAPALDALCGPDPADMTTCEPPADEPSFVAALEGASLAGKRLGVSPEQRALIRDPEVSAALDAALEAARSAGAELVEVTLPLVEAALPAYYVVATAEASSNLARYDGVHYGRRVEGQDLVELSARTRAEGFGAEVQRRILLGTFVLSSGFYDAYYLRAQRVRRRVRDALRAALAGVDALIGPTTPTPAWKLGEVADPLDVYAMDVFTVAANLAGLPAVSLPCGRSAAGLPLAVQLTGRPLGDPALLGLAGGLERAMDRPFSRPEGL